MATVGFGLESANVVGYNGVALRSGSKGVGACFKTITTAGVDLSTVTVTGYNVEDGSEDEVYAQTLDSQGKLVDLYNWIDVSYEEDGETVTLYGWMNADGELVEAGTKVFALGDGLWVNAPSEAYTLNFNGEVVKDGVDASLKVGSKMVSNPLPLNVDINNIIVKGYSAADGSEDEVYAQTLDSQGRLVDLYNWIDVSYEEDGETVTLYGWMNADGELVEDETVNVKAGEALWINSVSADYSVSFPEITL